jgi:hypothetical protein
VLNLLRGEAVTQRTFCSTTSRHQLLQVATYASVGGVACSDNTFKLDAKFLQEITFSSSFIPGVYDIVSTNFEEQEGSYNVLFLLGYSVFQKVTIGYILIFQKLVPSLKV